MDGITTSKRAADLVPGDSIKRSGRTYVVEDVTVTGRYVALGLVRILLDGSQGARSWPTVAASTVFDFRAREVSA